MLFSMEVTVLLIQRKKSNWNNSLFPFVTYLEVGMLQWPFPLLKLTDVKEVNDFLLLPNCAYFPKTK